MKISIKDAEREIFRKYNYGAYRDGVVSPEIWHKTKVKIMFVLKETNKHDECLRYFLRNGANPHTWNNVSRWIGGINGENFKQVKTITKQDRIDYLSTVCVINLKKKSGNSSTNTKEFRNFVLSNLDVIKEQTKLYYNDLNYIICCGDGVSELFLHSLDVKYEPSKKVYMIDNKVIVDFVHPCIRNRKRFNNNETAFNELMNLIRI